MTDERETIARAVAALGDSDAAPLSRTQQIAMMKGVKERHDIYAAQAMAAFAALDGPGVTREAPAPRAVDPLREALEAAIADTEADLIADADADERVDLNVYEVSFPLETARSISAALAAAPQPAPVNLDALERLLADLIKDRGYGVWDDATFTEDVRTFAQALIAAGLRLPSVVCHETPVGDTQAPLSITDDTQAPDVRRDAAAPRAVDPLREALEAYDAFISGKPIGPDTKAMADRASLAAAFAAAAYEKGYDRGQATHALLRSFLTAMLDPASPDLDYLRAVNQQPILAAAPQPVPVYREALVNAIEQGFQDARHMEEPRPHEAIADALLAVGLRLPGEVQPDETLAWAVVGPDGLLNHVTVNGRNHAKRWSNPRDRIVRVAVRSVEGEA